MIIDLAGTPDHRGLTYPLDGDSDFVVIVPTEPIGAHQRDPLRFLVSDDEFWITGRGPAFTFKHNPAPELWNPDLLRHEWVLIDGGLCQVAGVEMYRGMISPKWPYGDQPIGLLVRDRTDLPPSYHVSKLVGCSHVGDTENCNGHGGPW